MISNYMDYTQPENVNGFICVIFFFLEKINIILVFIFIFHLVICCNSGTETPCVVKLADCISAFQQTEQNDSSVVGMVIQRQGLTGDYAGVFTFIRLIIIIP